MYNKKIKIREKKIERITIDDGNQMIDKNGNLVFDVVLDENGKNVLDKNGDPELVPVINNSGESVEVKKKRKKSKIEKDKIDKIKEEKDKVNSLLNAYKLAQQQQLEYGGAGPVADFETMKIVNEHNSIFEIEVESEVSEEDY